MPIVSSLFTIKDYQQNAKDDYMQVLVAESEVHHKFPSLLSQLRKINMVATIAKTQYVRWLMPTLKSVKLSINDGTVITIYRLPVQKSKKKNALRFVPIALFVITLTVVFIDGLYKSDDFFAPPGIDPVMLAAVYAMSLMGILGIHELGHMIAAKHYGIKISWPYFIPSAPGVFSPTFGAIMRLRSNMPSRNAMFDVGISGPIAGLLVTIIVSIYGSSISVLITMADANALVEEGEQRYLNQNLLMMWTMEYGMDLSGRDASGMVIVMSPVMFAAWLGFFLTFLNLIPASQLDGGHIVRATLGAKYHKAITIIMIGAMFTIPLLVMPIFAPTFWIIGVIVLLITLRAPENPPLDDVTPLSRGRKLLFVLAMGMTVLCAPIPTILF
jgi:Zn-dependent protease